jgi:hypothetical protein
VNYQDTLHCCDYEGKTAFDLALECKCDGTVVLYIIKLCLPFDPVLLIDRDPTVHGYVWTSLVQKENCERYVEVILENNLHIARELCEAKDVHGRHAINIADSCCQLMLKQSLYFRRRYEILSTTVPDHKSFTSLVFFGIDHSDETETKVRCALSRDDGNDLIGDGLV